MSDAERFQQLTSTEAIESDLAARSVRAAAFTAIGSFADFALRIGSTAVLARLILPEHFGLVMMVTAVTAIADQLREMGLSAATIQRKQITHHEVSNLFWINTGVGALLAGLVCAAAPAVSAYYHEPRLTVITCLFSSTLLFGGLTVQHDALLSRRLRLGQAAAIRLGSNLLSTALAIVLAVMGLGYWALLWREISRAALLAIGVWIFVPWIPGLPCWNTDVRPLLKFGAHLTLGNLFATLVAGTDRLLLGRFCGANAVAMYRQAFQLISAPTDQLLSPLYQVTQPCLSLLQSDPLRYRRFYARVVTLVSVTTMPLSLFVAVYSREATLLLLGPRWVESASLLTILSIGTFMKQVVNSSIFVPVTRGNGAVYLHLNILQYTLVVALMAIGVRWGAVGISIANVASVYIIMAPRLYYSFRGSPVSTATFFQALARPAIASLLMAVVLVIVRPHQPSNSLIASLSIGVAMAATTFCLTWLLLPGGAGELRALASELRFALRRKHANLQAFEPAVTTPTGS